MNPIRNSVFKNVAGLHPGRSVFDLSYANKFSGKMGYIYPVYVEEVVPGDRFDLGSASVVRFAPMVAPPLHEIELHYHMFFVPYRILDDRTQDVNGKTLWERFITGGQAGVSGTLTRLNITGACTEGSLYDFLGVQVPGVTLAVNAGDDSPIVYPVYAYNQIINDFYRHETLDSLYALSDSALKTALWDQDYLTSALPWTQRGTTPALPVTGSSTALFASTGNMAGSLSWPAANSSNPQSMTHNSVTHAPNDAATKAALEAGSASIPQANILNALNAHNTVNLNDALTFTVNDLRLSIQIQRYLELSARAGYRYIEYLQAGYGVAPTDERLDQAEYIGGFVQPVHISEVLQSSASNLTGGSTPLGNLAGHGIMAGAQKVGRYHVKEFGIIMGMCYVAPKTAYQQGIRRNWLRKSRTDFYHPVFANLGEQAITEEEIYLQNAQASNLTIFGYQGRYNEMRYRNDEVHGAFRSTLNYWHLGRVFGSAPGLASAFVHIDPAACTRIFADTSGDHLWIHWGNRVRAIRPMPYVPEPGRMDHSYGGM